MTQPERGWTDKDVEQILGILLRTGVILAAVVVLIGCFFYLARHGSEPANYQAFRGEPAELRSLRGIIEDALALRARGIIQLGLLLLIATPVARVIFSVFAFARERDYTYVFLTLVVLAILTYSLVFGGI
jgi:uncharacterized membrane protein